MFRNYFKTAFRNIVRHKDYSLINVAGLAVGIGICLVIFVIIQFEGSYDNFHAKKNRIYRVLTEYHHADSPDIFYGNGVPRALPSALRNEFPKVEKVATIYTEGNDQMLVLDDAGNPVKKFKESSGVFFTEPTFFEIFDFRWLAGNAASALSTPNSVVLTKDIAEKYFGDWKEAVGKSIKWNNRELVKVTGILASIPPNTDFQLKAVITYGTGFTAKMARSTDWDNTGSDFGCYILLKPDNAEGVVNTQLGKLSKKMKAQDNKDSHIIQPLAKVHFDTQIGNYSGKRISPKLINALWLIAAFILLIGCINFINLSTALAVNRAKEVGVRKVLGSNKKQLISQFLMETFIIVCASALLAVAIAWICLPFIGRILAIPVRFIPDAQIIFFLLSVTALVTIMAGFYPSLVLSGYNPINALKSKFSAASTKGISLRRGLVVFQFIIAQALIIGTLIMIKQMDYFTRRSLGFEKDAIVNIPFPGDSTGISKLEFLRKELGDLKGIGKISFSSNTPVEDDDDNWSTFRYNRAVKETEFYSITKWTDNEYVPTYKLPLVAGRNLEPADTVREFLVNELLVKNLGIKDPNEVLGKEIGLWNDQIKGKIVGVLKDFNARSFRRDLAPVMMSTWKRGYSQAAIKIRAADMTPTMDAISKIWQTVFPDFVFEYQFLDAKVEGFYRQESKLSDLYKIFAVIAIFLSCLGLFGLASFMATQRIKEVGIRKVLGASSARIVYLFSKEFILLIGIAFVIASPIAWYFMHKWLQDYPFRINISWWMFLIGGIVSVAVALVSVSFRAFKAANVNPVKSLRTE